MISRGYITAGEAWLIVFIAGSVIGTAFFITVLFNNYYAQKADAPHIYRESDMCAIRVTAPCGDDICRYKASVPCDELEALIRKERKHDTEPKGDNKK